MDCYVMNKILKYSLYGILAFGVGIATFTAYSIKVSYFDHVNIIWIAKCNLSVLSCRHFEYKFRFKTETQLGKYSSNVS